MKIPIFWHSLSGLEENLKLTGQNYNHTIVRRFSSQNQEAVEIHNATIPYYQMLYIGPEVEVIYRPGVAGPVLQLDGAR